MLHDFARKAVGAKNHEPIRDALRRHEVYALSKIDRSIIYQDDLRLALRSVGINPGDIVMVHCGWRSFYGYMRGGGSLSSLVDMLRALVGDSGTLLMPSYGYSKDFFDVRNTPSNAGALSEVFRLQADVVRSAVPHFAIAGIGPATEMLFQDSFNCSYGFDDCAPYTKFLHVGGKVLLLGLQKHPCKISAFHRGIWLAESNGHIPPDWVQQDHMHLIDECGNAEERLVLRKRAGIKNDNAVFRAAFDRVPKEQVNLGALNICCFKGSSAVDVAFAWSRAGRFLYRGM